MCSSVTGSEREREFECIKTDAEQFLNYPKSFFFSNQFCQVIFILIFLMIRMYQRKNFVYKNRNCIAFSLR